MHRDFPVASQLCHYLTSPPLFHLMTLRSSLLERLKLGRVLPVQRREKVHVYARKHANNLFLR